MSGSTEWRLRRGSDFERELESFFNENYRNNKKGKELFNNEFGKIIENIIQNPRCHGSEQEPWPHKSYNPQFELRKYRFNAPSLTGSAKKARLIYLLDLKEKRIILLTVYTHKQEMTRPSDDKLKELLKSEME